MSLQLIAADVVEYRSVGAARHRGKYPFVARAEYVGGCGMVWVRVRTEFLRECFADGQCLTGDRCEDGVVNLHILRRDKRAMSHMLWHVCRALAAAGCQPLCPAERTV